MSEPTRRPGWYADPLKPQTQERRWDGTEWTDEVREASEATRAQRASEVTVVEEGAPRPSGDQVTDAPAASKATDPDDGPSTGSPGLETGAGATSSTTEADAPSPTTEGSGRATVVLVAAIVVLVAVLLLQVAYLWGPLQDDPTVSADRPVLLSQAAERSAADTAARAAVAFTERSYETYDEQVDAAAAMMTDGFAAEFRQTTDDAEQRWLDGEIEVTAEVAAQGVMTASDQQVEVLVFLNQFTAKKDEETAFTPFRLKVTLIDAESGWLVSDVDAT